MKIKNNRVKIGLAAVSATMLLSIAPGFADNVAPASSAAEKAIKTYVAANSATLGAAEGDIAVYANGSAQQDFANGVVTWNKRNGVRAITNEAQADVFVQTGGAEKFGALEGDTWQSKYCGPSVTTYDGTTRWMLVVDGGKQVGSYVDLNSEDGKNWKATRDANGKICFADNSATNTDSTIDWANADYSAANNGLVAVTDTTAYVIAADDLGKPVEGATAYEVEWLEWTLSHSDRAGQNAYAYWLTGLDEYGELGVPVAEATWNGDTSTQEFTGGTVTWTRGEQHPVIELKKQEETDENAPEKLNLDWSKASYIEVQQALYLQQGKTAYIIAADADGKSPAAGAVAYRSDWLGLMGAHADRWEWNQFTSWSYGSWTGEETVERSLGLPVANPVDVVENGVTYQTQEFQNGSIKWEKTTKYDGVKDAVITLK